MKNKNTDHSLREACREYAEICGRWATLGDIRNTEKNLIRAAMKLCGYQEHHGEWIKPQRVRKKEEHR